MTAPTQFGWTPNGRRGRVRGSVATSKPTRWARAKLSILLTAAVLLCSGATLHADATEGTFLLMSREGGGEWRQDSPDWRALPRLLHIDRFADTAWRSHSGQALLLGLSNRSVIALAPESSFRVAQFNQLPFINTQAQPELEPSGSTLRIRHESGRLLFKAGELRANSVITIRCEHGETRVTSGSLLIETHAAATRLWIFDGTATFMPDNDSARVFLTGGTSYHFHRQGAPLRFTFSETELEDSILVLLHAAKRGYERLAVIAADQPGLTRSEKRQHKHPRPRIVQAIE